MNKTLFNVVFYSKNSNLILASKIKDIFKKHKMHTSYLNEIDDVILKKYFKINFLVLDFTSYSLDDRSLELLIKLKNEGYIFKIVVLVKDKNVFDNENFDLILCEDGIDEELEKYLLSIKLDDFKKNINPTNISIIGDFLVELGLSPKYDGFLILIKAISYYLPRNLQIRNLNLTLYPYLSNSLLTSKQNIEMSLRTVIKCGYKNNNLNKYFTCCPTIKEFLNFCLAKVYGRLELNTWL